MALSDKEYFEQSATYLNLDTTKKPNGTYRNADVQGLWDAVFMAGKNSSGHHARLNRQDNPRDALGEEQSMRQAFEKWAAEHFSHWAIGEMLLAKHYDGTYVTTNVRDAFAGYQAGLIHPRMSEGEIADIIRDEMHHDYEIGYYGKPENIARALLAKLPAQQADVEKVAEAIFDASERPLNEAFCIKDNIKYSQLKSFRKASFLEMAQAAINAINGGMDESSH